MKQLFACVAAAVAVVAALGLSTARGAAGSRPRSGAHTTVHVSGRWTVVVRSGSGRVRRRVRFENALVGTSILPSLLTGTAVIGNWEIMAAESTAGDGSLAPASGPAGLKTWLLQTGQGTAVPELQVTATLPVAAGGTIGTLSTAVQLCGPGQSPGDCRASTADYVPFTSKGVSVPVKAGDTVSFTVLISFNPGNAASRFGTFPRTLVELLEGGVVPQAWEVGLDYMSGHIYGTTTTQVSGGSIALAETALFNPGSNGLTQIPTRDFSSGSAHLSLCDGTMSVTACQAATSSPTGTSIAFQFGTVYMQPGQQFTATYTLGFS